MMLALRRRLAPTCKGMRPSDTRYTVKRHLLSIAERASMDRVSIGYRKTETETETKTEIETKPKPGGRGEREGLWIISLGPANEANANAPA
jgi:hypothetical protein